MKEYLFPKEIWKIIKTYEYQIIQFTEMNEVMEKLDFNSFMPYYLSIHEYKGGDKLFEFAQQFSPSWNKYISQEKMKNICLRLDKKAKKDYD